jgi:hypothetical protein
MTHISFEIAPSVINDKLTGHESRCWPFDQPSPSPVPSAISERQRRELEASFHLQCLQLIERVLVL